METPESLHVNGLPGERFLEFQPELAAALPNLHANFNAADAFYENIKYSRNPQFPMQEFLVHYGPRGSIIFDENASKLDEALVVFSPYADVAPESNSRDIIKFSTIDDPTYPEIDQAKPHSWNQTTKSLQIYDLLTARGEGMPVITLYSPINQGYFSSVEKALFENGDFRPAGKLALDAIDYSETILMEQYGYYPEIDNIHFYGSSLGASNAVGAALEFQRNGIKNVASLTAQELILGPEKLLDMAPILGNYAINGTVHDSAFTEANESVERIAEPQMRQDIDQKGNEFKIYSRQIKALGQRKMLKGLTKPEQTKEYLREITSAKVPTLVATALNSAITRETAKHVDEAVKGNAHQLLFKGVENPIGHLVNEHVAASATTALLGINRAGSI